MGVGTTRRALLTGAGGGAGALLASACGAGGGQATAPRALDTAQKDELTWLVWSSDAGLRKDAYDAMTRRFTERFPNVTVTRTAGGNETFEKLITMLASDTRVDIVGTRPDYLAAYMEGPKPLQDLRVYLKRDTALKEADHVEGIVEGLSWKGTLHALPVGIYTNHAVVNFDLLAQKGIAPPPPTWTVDQALEIARRTTDRKEAEETSVWGIYHHWAVITHFVYSWIRGNGGEPMTPAENIQQSKWATDPETVSTIQWLVDLSQKQGVMPVKTTGDVWGPFTPGRAAITLLETNNLYNLVTSQAQGGAQFRWDVHTLPVPKRGRYQPINGFSYGLSRNTRNADLSFELLKEMVGPAGQTDWYRLARFAPSIKSLLNGAYLQEQEAPANKRAIVDAILAAKPMPKSPQWLEINKAVTEVLTRVRAGEVAVREGLADIDRRVGVLVAQR